MPIGWSEELATGIQTIDDQHKEIFKRINALLDAGKQGKGRQEVAGMIEFLEDYVKTHFAAEEAIQKEHAYPDYNQHKAMHTAFLKDVDKLKRELASEGATLSLSFEVNRTVVDWLVSHIMRVDKALAEFMRKHGHH
jgi:hemerythrin